jgi:hypothetical protein
MADNPAMTMVAAGRQAMNRAFKGIEYVGLALGCKLKGLIVIVPADFAF